MTNEIHEGEVLDSMPAEQSVQAAMVPLGLGDQYMRLAEMAMSQGKIQEMRDLLALKKEYEADEARKAFHEAVAQFKANPPSVYKDKRNNQYDSSYTSIGNMVNTVNAAMAPFGLSADWDIDQSDAKNIKVTCILSHSKGHSKQVSMAGPPDTTGAKNSLQQIKSTITYLKLATFEAVTGVASKEGNMDDDANASGAVNNQENMAKVADYEAAILDATDDVELGKIGTQISDCGLPPQLRTRLRKAYSARLKELRSATP